MVTLANLRGADLVVDPVPAIQAIGQGVGDVVVNREQETLFSGSSSPAQKRDAFLRISKINPPFAQVVLNLLEKQETLKLAQIAEKVDEQAKFSLLLQRLPNHEARVKALQDKQIEALAGGEDPTELGRMAEMDKDELKFKLAENIIAAQDFKTIAKPNVKEVDPTKFTAKSVEEFATTQDFSSLVPIETAETSPFSKVDPLAVTPESLETFEKDPRLSVLEPIGVLQTPEGKRFADQKLVNDTFGANSVEAKAMAQAFAAEDKPEVKISDVASLRGQYFKQSNNFIIIKSALKKVLSATSTPIGDVAKVFGIMKIFDPGSTVREGEQATAAEAREVPTNILTIYNLTVGGQSLTPKQRAEFDNLALITFNSQVPAQKQLQKFFTDIAKRQGMDSNLVVMDLIDTRAQNALDQAQTAAPAGPGAPTGRAPIAQAGGPPTTVAQPGGAFERFSVQEIP